MRWAMDQIPYEEIDRERIAKDRFLFKNLVIASFIEITSDVYDRNLSEFFQGDDAVVEWLNNTWEPEELQHGRSLRRYIETVWPDFDWESSYERFRERYLPLCKIELLQETRAREMLARMVVETGTSTLYQAMSRYAHDLNEPVLEELATKISRDEVYHFEAFEEAFVRYKKEEKLSRSEIVKILYARLKEINNEDVNIAYEAIGEDENYEAFIQEVQGFAKKYYPYKMAIKMFMRPLGINQHAENIIASTLQPAFRILGI
ncbi:ferritin-like domain-containing protein [Nitratifractor sp.]